MSIDFSQMDIAIATYNRPRQLQVLADVLVATAPAYHRMWVVWYNRLGIAEFRPPAHCQVITPGWPPEHHGCMAKMWNLAMLWAFSFSETEWLLCAMDDLLVTPGWPEVLAKYDADLYSAPAGDAGFLFNRRALREVGWFDERFPVIGFQEWDWQARAIRALGRERVSIEDAHGWRHNPVGLAGYWQHHGTDADRQRKADCDQLAAGWLAEKWGRGVGDMIGMLCSGVIAEPKVPEIEWYPWFKRA